MVLLVVLCMLFALLRLRLLLAARLAWVLPHCEDTGLEAPGVTLPPISETLFARLPRPELTGGKR